MKKPNRQDFRFEGLAAYTRALHRYIEHFEASNASSWVKFDFMDTDSRPPTPKKYLICRKDGKIHWEQWNGSGWAYNHNEIRYWAKIRSPHT